MDVLLKRPRNLRSCWAYIWLQHLGGGWRWVHLIPDCQWRLYSNL